MSVVTVALIGFALVGFFVVCAILEGFFKKAAREAVERQKTIEFGSLIMAALSVVVAVASVAYTFTSNSELEERIAALERVVQSIPKAATP
ncbi:hypothetical protein ACETIH_06620 [Microvirga arabica]|uniref:DUF350 domain-containing protein n=1 Tax=Microvirga arabica TaxID=1128671 RepID=A0ABV6Y555_9HYPH